MSNLTQNAKMKNSIILDGTAYRVFNFGIPAHRSRSGLVTCPMAGDCGDKGGCYALQGAYAWSNVQDAFERRLELTLTDEFIPALTKEIKTKLKTATKRGEKLVIRIHDSGDFYSLEYFMKWLTIAIDMPEVHFYAYTKMVPMLKRMKMPSNFRLIFSEGGKADHMIDENRHHSRVFSSHEELERAGYADASKNDLVAAVGDSHKIGLVYHGAKSKAWETA